MTLLFVHLRNNVRPDADVDAYQALLADKGLRVNDIDKEVKARLEKRQHDEEAVRQTNENEQERRNAAKRHELKQLLPDLLQVLTEKALDDAKIVYLGEPPNGIVERLFCPRPKPKAGWHLYDAKGAVRGDEFSWPVYLLSDGTLAEEFRLPHSVDSIEGDVTPIIEKVHDLLSKYGA